MSEIKKMELKIGEEHFFLPNDMKMLENNALWHFLKNYKDKEVIMNKVREGLPFKMQTVFKSGLGESVVNVEFYEYRG
jgi:hypothetical protein